VEGEGQEQEGPMTVRNSDASSVAGRGAVEGKDRPGSVKRRGRRQGRGGGAQHTAVWIPAIVQ